VFDEVVNGVLICKTAPKCLFIQELQPGVSPRCAHSISSSVFFSVEVDKLSLKLVLGACIFFVGVEIDTRKRVQRAVAAAAHSNSAFTTTARNSAVCIVAT
jgi:hypothetical protein